jgi:hypothetical protein
MDATRRTPGPTGWMLDVHMVFRHHHHAHLNAFVRTSPTTAPRCGARLGLVSRRTRPVLRPHLRCFARTSHVPPPLAASRPGARQARVGCLGLCVPLEHHADATGGPKLGCLERVVLPRVVNLVLRNTAAITLGWSSLLLQCSGWVCVPALPLVWPLELSS